MYCNKTLKRYLDDLAAKLPAPGGGSAAALNAALGTALISMVVNFTLGKPRYAQYEPELKDALKRSEKLRERFLELVDLDVVAYKSKNMRDALDIPFMVCRLSFEAIKLCPPLIEKGNVNLVSDVAVAAVFLEAAFTSACFNVDINLRSIGDKKLAAAVKKELKHKGGLIRRLKSGIEKKINGMLE